MEPAFGAVEGVMIKDQELSDVAQFYVRRV